ncbi:hypothetical protein CTheo_6369 [Ceratobasidium theobromae]|uniref:Uncharacterized protein n=1 Tax=Ceratobasidium theobromae TaxID=1582974 RepID=A0A5N5QEM1_9AGAM|nr:hypothetical protein CTheo_6369 [Ceratobasidium theobromae]
MTWQIPTSLVPSALARIFTQLGSRTVNEVGGPERAGLLLAELFLESGAGPWRDALRRYTMSWVDLYQISHRASRPVARKTVIIEPQVFTPDEGTSSMVVTRPVNQPTTQQYPNREQRTNTCRTLILRTGLAFTFG